MGDLTRDFSRWELECRCGCGLMPFLPVAVGELQILRGACGFPFNVNSGFR